ncbi:IS630 family transposase [Amaricoccus solimangrovi]|uniref:IS630 family transposase n=1 Tax=Amaricoccus solimangrovi TaxID=2589815 RepID=UPI001F1B99D5|nr:IS630 family transposase [Amaricoccus solimangrovi]
MIRWDAQRRTTGSFEPKQRGGDTRSRRIEARHADVMAAFEEERDQSLEELRARLAERGIAASSSALSRFFQRHGLTRKKRPGTRSSRSARTCLEQAPRLVRGAARSRSRQARVHRRDLDGDEHGPHPWALPPGRTTADGVSHSHRTTTTLIAGLRLDGMVAPMVLDGPVNGDWFEAYVAKVLAPTLRPGDIVIMDNLSSHKRASVRAMIEARGARLAFLPPYSPDFNPIEMAFAKLKALLRKAAERTVDGLWNTIGRLVDVFTPQECAHYFAAAGYDAD